MGVQKCLTRNFQWKNLGLSHEFTSDFYLSCWQKNRSSFPLFCIRAVLFLGCLATVVSSMILIDVGGLGYWFIFMTHWGITLNAIATGAALAVSARANFKGPIDGTFGVPWYVRLYWLLFNTAVTNSIFITIFYYSLLTEIEDVDYAIDPVLNFFVHGANSIIMGVLLLVSRHPVRLLHFYQPVAFALIYLIFSVIYYYAGGISPFGTDWIYPMLDWKDPGVSMITAVVSGVAILVVHIVVFSIALLRDTLSSKYTRSSMSISIADAY